MVRSTCLANLKKRKKKKNDNQRNSRKIAALRCFFCPVESDKDVQFVVDTFNGSIEEMNVTRIPAEDEQARHELRESYTKRWWQRKNNWIDFSNGKVNLVNKGECWGCYIIQRMGDGEIGFVCWHLKFTMIGEFRSCNLDVCLVLEKEWRKQQVGKEVIYKLIESILQFLPGFTVHVQVSMDSGNHEVIGLCRSLEMEEIRKEEVGDGTSAKWKNWKYKDITWVKNSKWYWKDASSYDMIAGCDEKLKAGHRYLNMIRLIDNHEDVIKKLRAYTLYILKKEQDKIDEEVHPWNNTEQDFPVTPFLAIQYSELSSKDEEIGSAVMEYEQSLAVDSILQQNLRMTQSFLESILLDSPTRSDGTLSDSDTILSDFCGSNESFNSETLSDSYESLSNDYSFHQAYVFLREVE